MMLLIFLILSIAVVLIGVLLLLEFIFFLALLVLRPFILGRLATFLSFLVIRIFLIRIIILVVVSVVVLYLLVIQVRSIRSLVLELQLQIAFLKDLVRFVLLGVEDAVLVILILELAQVNLTVNLQLIVVELLFYESVHVYEVVGVIYITHDVVDFTQDVLVRVEKNAVQVDDELDLLLLDHELSLAKGNDAAYSLVFGR